VHNGVLAFLPISVVTKSALDVFGNGIPKIIRRRLKASNPSEFIENRRLKQVIVIK